jgi:hypothetical protein
MDKIFDRLRVEFLIPAFLMLLFLLLAFDLILGTAFDLEHFNKSCSHNG